jgi:protein TonB
MFETSTIREQAQTAGRVSLLTASLIAHSTVILGAIAFSIATIDFPTNAPDAFAFSPELIAVRIPPPLGNPNGGAPKPQPPAAKSLAAPPVQPNQPTAPSQIPNEIPTVDTPSNIATTAGSGESNPTGTVPGPVGVPWGTKDSVGDLDAPPAPATNATPIEEKIYEAHEVKAPVLRHRVDPPYPPQLLKTRIPALVVVRCVIDKNGRVRDPQIVRAALPPFNAAVLDAVQQWRYTPGSRNGIAVETYLTLTVTFSVK